MKLLFSEQNSTTNITSFPTPSGPCRAGETPSDISTPASCVVADLDRFYLCRQVRVALAKFKPSSENRRILRKGAGIDVKLVPRDKYNYTPERREFFKTYADIKFGKDVMTFERLTRCLARPSFRICSCSPTRRRTGNRRRHALSEGKALAFYYYAFTI